MSLPLAELRREGGGEPLRRVRYLSPAEARGMIGADGPAVVIAELVAPLKWYEGDECAEIWRIELRDRIAAPEGFRLEQFPGGRCYLASEWRGPAGAACVLFEMHH